MGKLVSKSKNGRSSSNSEEISIEECSFCSHCLSAHCAAAAVRWVYVVTNPEGSTCPVFDLHVGMIMRGKLLEVLIILKKRQSDF